MGSKGIPIGCVHCAIPLDRPGMPKALRCSRCGASYCSKEHQLLHWPLHKPECVQRSQLDRNLEVYSLATPSMAAMFQDFDKHREQLFPEIIVAARSAFLIGKPGQRHSSSVLTLQFKWHPHKSSPRRRFVLDEVSAFSLADMISIAEPETMSLLTDPLPHAPAGQLLWRNLIRLTNTTNGKSTTMMLPHSVSSGMYDLYVPASKRTIDEDWDATLKRGLSRPEVRSWKSLDLEDLLQTEGFAKMKTTILASSGVPRAMAQEDFVELQRLEKERGGKGQ
ncbi:hypothetical protein RQP46_004581 [Phenoliferia psychrophenolica]